ncbi:hypothetical protein IJ531_01980 [bacterium]|nr:hypothetical protein [bacterium]
MPYTRNGIEIIPIAQNPDNQQIENAVNATYSTNSLGKGMNGRAYCFGEDLVVKKYSRNQGAKREIGVLDEMYDKGTIIPDIQQGMYAFTLPNGEKYLVSTKIEGKNPDPHTNKFNSGNLKELMRIITKFDMPAANDDIYTSRELFPYSVPMHYDLHMGNINITQTSAGIFDLEFLQYENLSRKMEAQLHYNTDCDCNFSDIPGIVSNLRSFEYRALVPYLLQLPTNEADEFFETYLKYKADYHSERCNFYIQESHNLKNVNEPLSRLTSELAQKEAAHAYMLNTCDKNVIASEKIKMQLANFIYSQSNIEKRTKTRFNRKQIEDYTQSAVSYFNNMYHLSNSEPEKIYYKDCVELMKNWYGVINWMNWQTKKPSFDMFNWENKPVDEMSDDDFHIIQERYKRQREDYELFNIKSSDDYQPVIYEFD